MATSNSAELDPGIPSESLPVPAEESSNEKGIDKNQMKHINVLLIMFGVSNGIIFKLLVSF